MGLLSLGTPMDWHESKKWNEHVRENGIEQLLNIFRQHAKRDGDKFLWGDEVEYMLVDVNRKEAQARLSIDHDHILEDLNDEEGHPEQFARAEAANVSFHPEYGRFMLEATPLRPYDGTNLCDYLYVEENMVDRRVVAKELLPANIVPLTLTAFPRMGCATFTLPPAKAIGPASQSLFLPDEIINRHVRFPTLTANIRKRRGAKVSINLPMFPDVNTKLIDDLIPLNRDLFLLDLEPWLGALKPGHVYMDLMGFGMGLSCLQVTMQGSDINESRYLYDTLAPLTPVLLAASAASPIFKGYLVNQDVRWNVISGAVDDRTFIERNVEPYRGYDVFGGLDVLKLDKEHVEKLGGGVGVNGDRVVNSSGDTLLQTLDGKPIQKVPKSRYDSIDSYLGDLQHDTKYFDPQYNDIYSPINSKVLSQLSQEKGLIDEQLSKHFAHLFIRDPLVLFLERIDQDNKLENDHFENIQSTNWQTLRFKPPALYPATRDLLTTPGWRVEFRPLEIQLTDFENAAYSVFISLLSKAIIKFKPNLYVPILKIDENMKTAHNVDAVTKDKFWFRSQDSWGLNHDEFIGYDLLWFDRFINRGNDELGVDEVYLNGYKDKETIEEETANCDDGDNDSDITATSSNGTSANNASLPFSKLLANEIINGSACHPGLIRLIVKLIATELLPETAQHHCDTSKLAQQMTKLQNYLKLVSYRASGKIPTIAHWMRTVVTQSPEYARDSKVTERLNYDLIEKTIHVSDYDFTAAGGLLTEYFGADIALYLKETGYGQ